ncbi:WD repeat-containing protein 6-like [Haliotis rufescens]|uniref:WD repeat-containing protein 6-like n=1 Tax=Haliotis rufescens TaxID=6454 RepID=UPI00201E8E00|nr:WD repeat-containing protein 6-like [Haliotis rufescens]
MATKDISDMSIKTEFHTGPVTAVSILKGHVLAGIGGSVHVYETEKREQVALQYVLPCRNIHGIIRDLTENVFCAYGEKCFRIFSTSADPEIRVDCQDEAVVLEDWILDVRFMEEPESQQCEQLAVAVAHNVILLWDITSRTLLHRVDCVEKCILYCAHFINTSWSNLVLAAGTVFNQVIVWSPHGARNNQEQREVIHRLKGHQGVIFSIDYNPKTSILASVSDDRTIRLWKLTFPSNSLDPSISDWCEMESRSLLTLYGHSARVWDIELLADIFVSVGEDATCIVWDYAGNILHKFKGHKGKSIWSLACDKSGKFVVTGGGDASIRMWLLDDADHHQEAPQLSLSLPSHLQGEKDDFARSIAMCGMDIVLIMTNGGCLLRYSVSSRTWTCLYQDALFSSYTVMAVYPSNTLVAIGNITGTVKVFDVGTCALCSGGQIFEGKVFGLTWVDTGHMLTTGPQGMMYILSAPSLAKTACLTLPVCKQRWASAGVLCAALGVLVCGDRGGTVHCYHINPGDQATATLPASSFAKIHGKAGVTDVCYHGNTVYTSGRDGQYRQWDVTDRELTLRSSHRVMKGMDWIDRLHVTADDTLVYGFHSSCFTLWSVTQNLRLMDVECGGGHRAWDCRLRGGTARFVYLKTKHILVCDTACRSRQVILKGSLHGRELCDVRHITTSRGRHGNAVHVLATCSEDTTVQLVSISSHRGISNLTVHHTLQGHLSTVKTLAVSCSTKGQGQLQDHEKIIFSGGGRAQIQVWKVKVNPTNETKGIIPEESDQELITNVKDATRESNFPSGDKSHISQSNGLTPGVRQISDTPCSYEHLSSVFLCGERHRGCRSASGGQSDPETRVMCLTALCLREVSDDYPDTLHVVGAACSDALVRIFGYDEKQKSLTLLQQSSYHDNCVLKVSHIIHQSHPRSRVMLLSAATEGQIAFWDISHICQTYAETRSPCDTDSHQTHIPKQEVDEEQYGEHLEYQPSNESCDSERTSFHPSSAEDRDKTCVGHKSGSFLKPDSGQRVYSRRETLKTLEESVQVAMMPVATVKCHQSGINALHVFCLGDERYLIASGGDDNCLTVTCVHVTAAGDEMGVHVEGCWKNAHAHAAQITGVWVLSDQLVVSASIDQRVCVWELSDAGTQHFKMVACRYVHFSDISNIDVWQERSVVYLFLCGEGLTVLHIDTEEM